MTMAIGGVSAVLGTVYLTLGVIAAQELISSRRTYGMSRFGLGFILMASSCGPHHILHAMHVLHGHDISGVVAAATLLALPPGVVFVALRIEAMLGGRGDRFVSGTPNWLLVIPAMSLIGVGSMIARSLSDGIDDGGVVSVTFGANAFAAGAYALVGWPLVRTQVRRRSEAGGWSLAGLSLAAVFPTCATSHLMYALTARGDAHTALVDLWGIPASLYFLWVVRALYRDAIIDWNARPATGRRRLSQRPPPWQARHALRTRPRDSRDIQLRRSGVHRITDRVFVDQRSPQSDQFTDVTDPAPALEVTSTPATPQR